MSEIILTRSYSSQSDPLCPIFTRISVLLANSFRLHQPLYIDLKKVPFRREGAAVTAQFVLICLVLGIRQQDLSRLDPIVCGHYGCGGVRAALRDNRLGLIDNWLRHVQDVRQKHEARLAVIREEGQRWDRLCELNVIEQVVNVCQTTIVQDAWERGQELAVHGWIYALQDGLLRDLNLCVTRLDETTEAYEAAVRR